MIAWLSGDRGPATFHREPVSRAAPLREGLWSPIYPHTLRQCRPTYDSCNVAISFEHSIISDLHRFVRETQMTAQW